MTPVPASRRRLMTIAVIAVAAIVITVVLTVRGNPDTAARTDTAPLSTSVTATPTGPATLTSRTRTTAPKPTVPRTSSTPRTTSATGRTTASSAGTTGVDPDSGLRWIAESALPPQARQTLGLIRAGGPFPFPRNDDKPYYNNNRILPRQPSGYYREYTVITPGSPDRGARRIVAARNGAKYYTADHYDSFRRIKEGS